MNTRHKDVRTTVAVVCGAVLGAGLVLPVAYGIAMQHAVEELAGYAGRVLRVSERGAAETRHAMITVRDDRLPFCSDDELALMRRLIYDSYFVRDLGRSRDGLIYCTSSRGRFVKPIQVVEPELLGRMGASDVMFGVSPDQGVAIAPGLTGIMR